MPRFLFILLFGLVVSEVGASQAAPDTTDPARYYPLEVGNRWEHEPASGSTDGDQRYFRFTIASETTIDGEQWFVQRSESFEFNGDGFVQTGNAEFIIRYDPTVAGLVQYSQDETTPLFPCPFNGTVGTVETCSGGGEYEKRTISLDVGSETLTGRALEIKTDTTSVLLLAGVGFVGRDSADDAETTLAYASVGGETFGSPLPVSTEGLPEEPALRLQPRPNPTVGPLALHLDLPGATSGVVEAFDTLGRRVYRAALSRPAGPNRLDLDTSQWEPGLYMVRFVSGATAASTTFVRL